jgi:chemotaxis protein MotA
MVVIVGCIVVIGAVLAGFSMAGGQIGALIHPSEFVTIGGAAFGAMILMSPVKVLKDLLSGLVQSLKGSPFGKPAYEDLFKLLYDLLRLARRDGLMALESHLSSPHESKIFQKYPRVAGNHHVTEFICGAFTLIVEGTVKADQLPGMLESEIKAMEEEHHAPLSVLQKTADGLPGFGIVAAVLGIVITMGAINGPVDEIGEKVGAALVGTFLGILMSYGFLGPMAVRLEFLGAAELGFFRSIAAVVEGAANAVPPKVALEVARRGLSGEVKISRERLDALFREAEAS